MSWTGPIPVGTGFAALERARHAGLTDRWACIVGTPGRDDVEHEAPRVDQAELLAETSSPTSSSATSSAARSTGHRRPDGCPGAGSSPAVTPIKEAGPAEPRAGASVGASVTGRA